VIDLSDKSGAIVGFSGNTASSIVGCTLCGDQKTWLIGVNWWLNDYTRLVLNVTQSKIEGSNPFNAVGTPGPNGTGGANQSKGAEITGVGLRAQVDW
jgi:phosphate-selective porin OprO and OprP